MIFIIIAMITLGIFEIYVYHTHHYPEDLFFVTAAFGVAMFLAALMLK